MEEKTGQKLALFDLDGTLTRKDTFLELIKHIHGKYRFFSGIFRLFPWLVLYKIGVIPNRQAKEKVLTCFFEGMAFDFFQQKCDQFAVEKFPTLLKKDAIEVFRQLQDEGTEIAIVSASAENWVAPWCKIQKVACIATRLEVRDGKLTGKIKGRNCNGTEKVNRIREAMDLSRYNEILAYGDSHGDLPMLKLATNAYYKFFRE